MKTTPVRALPALLLFLGMAVLASCGGGASTPPAGSEAPAAAPSGGAEGALNVFIWSEYIDPEIVKDFETQNHCKVSIDLYEDNESMLAKLQAGGTSQYDIVVPSDYIMPAMIAGNLLAPIRHENVPNMVNLDDRLASPPFDPGNVYSAPYQWGTVGIYLRKKAGKEPERTWGLVFDAKKQWGNFLMIDSQREMIGPALKFGGHSINSTDEGELKGALKLLLDAKKRSQGFEGGVGGKNKVLSKSADLAVVYNGDAVRGTKEDADTMYFVPEEGGEIWMDSMAIPAQAPHRDMAEKFVNFILDPHVGARLSNFNQYATPNKASREFVNKEDLANDAIYPTDAMMAKLEFLKELGDKSRLYDEIWTQAKSK
jgi:spermidine/putrescine transport system substrate-binding protein